MLTIIVHLNNMNIINHKVKDEEIWILILEGGLLKVQRLVGLDLICLQIGRLKKIVSVKDLQCQADNLTILSWHQTLYQFMLLIEEPFTKERLKRKRRKRKRLSKKKFLKVFMVFTLRKKSKTL